MGYRSDVAFALRGEGVALSLIQKGLPKVFELADRKAVIDGVHYWYWESVKWYDNYSEIKEFDLWLLELDAYCELLRADLPDGSKSAAPEYYGFVRIGEEDDDNVTKGVPWEFDLSIHRHIEMPSELMDNS